MNDLNIEREVNIDIGGGKGAEFFLKLAQENPEETFLVFDPAIEQIPENSPKNLHLIKWGSKWRSEVPSSIPLKDNSVDKAYLIFLTGELYEDQEAVSDLKSYPALVADLKRVIKAGGSIFVSEPRAHIETAREIFDKAGFRVGTSFPMLDITRTAWIELFFHLACDTFHQKGFHDPRRSSVYPMEFCAWK